MGEVDQLRPWLGLDSFSEHTRAFFYGRDEEVGELARRVQRKLLTVLFGQSGLGKTSILRAGIVPRLRGEGYCPVYVRIDYGPEALLPAQQVRRAIEAVARYDGEALPAGESLWALLHQRSGSFTDAEGAPLMPLLIFDQFEEIFTLAQGDGGARARAAQFVDELACLVENRAPRELEERMNSDDTLVERYDFAREDYRVLISLREDYLAHLESLKAAMPSITQNRMRLAPMNGAQALQAVRLPGGELVTEEVAEAIVRFVAGGAEIGHAQIEPSLLSLICRELNDTRIASGRAAITLDLLAGSHASILSDFYERAMVEHPPAVRAIIEDVLLTDSGYRENVAQERIEQLLANAGAGPGALTDLVNRRLLRIEERLDLRRVELTHDVLCSVVRASRDLRQEREARIENERKLAEQQASELATRKSLMRTRQVAIGSAALAALAVVAFGFAWNASERAASAEKTAGATRLSAGVARDQAELLISYLNEDFAQQLSGVARKDVVEGLNKRTLDYYLNLPAIEPGSDTERNYAVAMVRYGVTMRFTSRLAESEKYLKQAVALLEARRARGDVSSDTAVALSRGYLGQRRLSWARQEIALAFVQASAAAVTLKPWATQDGASVAIRRLYAEILNSKAGAELYFSIPDAIKTFDQSAAIFTLLGGANFSDMDAAGQLLNIAAESIYIRHLAAAPNLQQYGDHSEKQGRLLFERDPTNVSARPGMAYLMGNRGMIAFDEHDMRTALKYHDQSVEEYRAGLRLDPVNQNLAVNLIDVAQDPLGKLYVRAGQPEKAIQTWRQAIQENISADEDIASLGVKLNLFGSIGYLQAQLGDPAALRSFRDGAELLTAFSTKYPDRAGLLDPLNCPFAIQQSKAAMAKGDLFHALALLGSKQLQAAQAAKSSPLDECPDQLNEQVGEIHLAAGRYTQAVAALSRFKVPRQLNNEKHPELARTRRLLSLARAYSGAGNQAATSKLVGSMLADQRKAVALQGGDLMLDVELAAMLVLQSRSEPRHSHAALGEARALLAALPPKIKLMYDVRKWQLLLDKPIRKADKA